MATRVWLVLLVAGLPIVCSEPLRTKAWQNIGFEYTWPEHESSTKDLTGVTLSGGGYRAYTSGIGILRGLHHLELRSDYLVGVSGGSWATATYTYGNDTDEAALLGSMMMPNELSLENLAQTDDRCALSVLTQSLWGRVAEKIVIGTGVYQSWQDSLEEIFLSPRGVPKGALLSLDNGSVAEIVAANPQLSNQTWATVHPHRAYPILCTTLVGPVISAPFSSTAPFSGNEVTPLYIGDPYTSNLTFISPGGVVTFNILVGGQVQPFAYGGLAPDVGLGSAKEGVLSVPLPSKLYTLAQGIAESSWFPGAFLTELSRTVSDLTSNTNHYWSPATAAPASVPFFVGDGGDVENTGIMSMLRRKVRRIVLCDFSVDPLVPSTRWNPMNRTVQPKDMGDVVPSLFGYFLDKETDREFNYRQNQVFDQAGFAPIAAKLQAGLESGKGAVAQVELQTIENLHWGIPANQSVNLTIFYLSRCLEWENQLPEDVRKLVQPQHGDVNDTSNLVSGGPFSRFPHYPTSTLQYSNSQANLLAALVSWVVAENAAVFTLALQSSTT